jgi:hypothetical protein
VLGERLSNSSKPRVAFESALKSCRFQWVICNTEQVMHELIDNHHVAVIPSV